MKDPTGSLTPALAERDGTPMSPRARRALLVLVFITFGIALYSLRGGAYFEPTDCWVAQTAREMYEANDWLIPRYSGEVRMQKSPGPYWAVMATAWLRGGTIDEAAARFPNAVAGVVLVATIFWLTRRIAGEDAAIFAGFGAASSALVLYWMHRGASDLGLTACTTVALATLWVALEDEPRGPKRVALLLIGYFAAGVGMLYKMPMPLAVVGAPAIAYVVLRGRWTVLRDPWHLVGFALFLLPWVPWVWAVVQQEPTAWHKWRVEFLDRYSGDLPNVEGQNSWQYLGFYLVPTLLFAIPYTVSVPGALGRPFQRGIAAQRDGLWFAFIWYAALLVFFTSAAGKEWRYFLPALPPVFVLLGVDLNLALRHFASGKPKWPLTFAAWAGIAAVAAGVVLIVRNVWFKHLGPYEPAPMTLEGRLTAARLLQPMIVAVVLFATAAAISVWLLLVRRRPMTAFASIVIGMWATWMWSWPNLFPIFASQAGFRDFARQLTELIPPEQARDLAARRRFVQIAHQDPRVIWYSDYRFPRIIDQLELLEEQDGRRDLTYERKRIGQEMVDFLSAPELGLMAIGVREYIEFRVVAEFVAQRIGRALPPCFIWIQPRFGRPDKNMLLVANQPRLDGAVLDFEIPEQLREKVLEKAKELFGEDLSGAFDVAAEVELPRVDAVPAAAPPTAAPATP